MNRTIKDIQQDFATYSGYSNEVIWDALSSQQSQLLKDKIAQLIPEPDIDTARSARLREVQRIRQTLFTKVWEQRKYTNGNSLSAIIYVLVTKATTRETAYNSTEFSCHPVFRLRKCTAQNDSSMCCMIFVDEEGRVYRNWASFCSSNVLPMGLMVAPSMGVYTFNHNNKVQLEIRQTPACESSTQLLGTVDRASAFAGIGSACVPIAALLSIPVAAPVMAMAGAVGLTVGAYSMLRSAANLHDRNQHEQPINLSDRHARNSWLGIATGMVGVGASGTTRALTSAVAAGKEVSAVTQLVVNGMNISSILLSAGGVANGALDMILRYKDGEEISVLDVVQLSASLFIFTHSVRNFQLASNIINETRTGTIQSYREGLSNRQRRMFDRMSRETIRIKGPEQAKIDIIRTVNDIPSKQYLNDLYKINSDLNRRNVRPSFGGAGAGVVLNNELPVDTQVLRNNVQHNIGPNVIGQVTQPIPITHTSSDTTVQLQSNTNGALLRSANAGLNAETRIPSHVEKLFTGSVFLFSNAVRFGNTILENIGSCESFEDVVTTMAKVLVNESFALLINIAREFFDNHVQQIQQLITIHICSELVLHRLLEHCYRQYSNLSFDYLKTKKEEIIIALRNYFISLNPNSPQNMMKKCPHCPGHFAVCNF